MAIYRLIAPLADLNALSCIDSQVYQARGIVMAKFTFHITPFSSYLPKANKKGSPRTGQGNPLTKNAQKGGYPAAFLCVVVVVFKRS